MLINLPVQLQFVDGEDYMVLVDHHGEIVCEYHDRETVEHIRAGRIDPVADHLVDMLWLETLHCQRRHPTGRFFRAIFRSSKYPVSTSRT